MRGFGVCALAPRPRRMHVDAIAGLPCDSAEVPAAPEDSHDQTFAWPCCLPDRGCWSFRLCVEPPPASAATRACTRRRSGTAATAGHAVRPDAGAAARREDP